jgi:hypothetical protein
MHRPIRRENMLYAASLKQLTCSFGIVSFTSFRLLSAYRTAATHPHARSSKRAGPLLTFETLENDRPSRTEAQSTCFACLLCRPSERTRKSWSGIDVRLSAKFNVIHVRNPSK